MATSSKNLFSNKNFTIANSIILNNYSIQNLYFSPPNVKTIGKIPINGINYFQNNNNLSLSHSQKKTVKNLSNNSLKKSSIFNNITPIATFRNRSKINYINIKKIPVMKPKMKIIPKIISIPKIQKIEKRPEDSVKKKNQKKNTIFKRSNTSKKILKSSISTRIFKTFKNSALDRFELTTEISLPRNNLSKKKEIIPLNTKIIYLEPKEKINLKEFQFREQIGKGTFGKIFSVKWIKNNKYYAMKKEILTDIEEVEKRRNTCKIIQNYIQTTGNKGVIILYGNLCFKVKKEKDDHKDKIIKLVNKNKFIYYQLMEKAELDWNKEINFRTEYKLYYTEKEIINIMTQLIKTLSSLQKNHITHRDIKPQNILIFNGKYKLGDLGEIRVLKRDGLIVQRVRGSELYMSPILFNGLHSNLYQVRHNTYKSDVFSLGMCLFYAASLTYSGVDSIRELTDMKKIKNILFHYLSQNYSEKLIMFIFSMLEIDENKRMDFIQLEEKLHF